MANIVGNMGVARGTLGSCLSLASRYYFIASPDRIRSNYEFHVLVTIIGDDLSLPVKMKLSIKGDDNCLAAEVFEVLPNSTKLVNFKLDTEFFNNFLKVPAHSNSELLLTFDDKTNVEFEHSVGLIYVKERFVKLVQLDKETYSPGDVVNFRVLAFDKYMKKISAIKSGNLYVKDSNGSVVEEFSDIIFANGLFEGAISLSQTALSGKWSIIEEGRTLKKFDVNENNVEISIETSQNIFFGDEKINFTFKARCCDGKLFKGCSTITFKIFSINTKQVSQTLLVDNECMHVEMYIPKDLDFNDLDKLSAVISVTITDDITGNQTTKYEHVNINKKKFIIDWLEIPWYVFAGSPFKYRLVIKQYDGSIIKCSATPVIVSFTLKDKKEGSDNSLDGSSINEYFPDENGIVTFWRSFVENCDETISLKVQYHDIEKEVVITKRRRDSESMGGTLYVEIKCERLVLNKEIILKITTSNPELKHFYGILAREDFIQAGELKFPGECKSLDLNIKPTFIMFPMATFLIYFVKDKELIANMQYLRFNCDQNEFALQCEESAVSLKKGKCEYKFYENDLIEALKPFNPHSCYQSGMIDVKPDLELAGFEVMSNAVFPNLSVETEEERTKRLEFFKKKKVNRSCCKLVQK